ncbi:hypothetical protein ARSEF4850_008877 [Beauveria asiatica]
MEYDTIAYLYPHKDENALKAIKADPRHKPPRLERPPPRLERPPPRLERPPPRLERRRTRYSRGERESTEPPENQGASTLDYLPYLEITFSDIPRTNRGLMFGSNPNCDVVLDDEGISNVHFSLAFD